MQLLGLERCWESFSGSHGPYLGILGFPLSHASAPTQAFEYLSWCVGSIQAMHIQVMEPEEICKAGV